MASILRNSIARNARIVARGNIVAGRVPLFVRYSSSQPPLAPEEIMKQVLEKHGNLQRDNNAKTVGYEELLPLTQSLPEDTTLIDIRETKETMQGMIPSAVNIPLTTLGESLQLDPKIFKAEYGIEKPGKDQRVIFYCRKGLRVTAASALAKHYGFSNVMYYPGSWLEWAKRQNLRWSPA